MSEEQKKPKPTSWTMATNDEAINNRLQQALDEAIKANPYTNKNKFLFDLICKGLDFHQPASEPIIKEVEKIVEKVEHVEFFQKLLHNETFKEIANARIESEISKSDEDLICQCVDFALRYNHKNFINKKRIHDFGFAVPESPVYEPIQNFQNFYNRFEK